MPFNSSSQEQAGLIKTVVIDAGHGGKDPGAVGFDLKEKDIALSVALNLGKMIQQNHPETKVIYTRDDNTFVELGERAKIANQNNADLFISIHANAGPASASGAEVFVLGLHRSEEQRKVAERENASIYLEDDGGEKYEDFDMSPDAIIIRTLQLSIFLDHSINFAAKIMGEFDKLGRRNRGVKQAGFIVLYKTTMPSVLVEVGFISNKEEAKFMSDSKNLTKLAESIYNAFAEYKKVYERSSDNGVVKNGEHFEKEKEVEEGQKVDIDEVLFRVQIATSMDEIQNKREHFGDLDIWEYKDDNVFKYTAGKFTDFNDANEYKNKMRNELNYENAFVVAFQGNIRINLQKAIKLAEK